MKELLNTACKLLEQGEGFVLARVINRLGSAPRTAGAQMIILEDGSISGTIGGGTLEARTIEASRTVFNNEGSRILAFDLSSDDASTMDMICGGSVDILLHFFDATEQNRELFSAFWRACSDHSQALFATSIREADGEIVQIDHCLIGPENRVNGKLPLSEESFNKILNAWATHGPETSTMTEVVEDVTVIVESILKQKKLCILGAGHVAQPTASIAAMMDFSVVILDDRKDFANDLRFPEADEIHILDDFDHALAGQNVDNDTYVVILTRGHLHDKTVLAQALRSKAGYIGMIGSHRKRDAIYRNLLHEGFGERDLKRVYSPIGLPISAETPEEIALSIVAELVQHRASV